MFQKPPGSACLALSILLLLPSSYGFSQQYRQPTAEEIAGGQSLKRKVTKLLRLPSSASWDRIYQSYLDQSRIATCEELRKKGFKDSCDWDSIQIMTIALNDPEVQMQSSLDTASVLIAEKLVAIRTSLADSCANFTPRSPWKDLLVCSMKKQDSDHRKQLNFPPGTPIEVIDYVWKREQNSTIGNPVWKGTM